MISIEQFEKEIDLIIKNGYREDVGDGDHTSLSQKAIEYLSKFSSNDEILGPTAIGAIGDAFADIDQTEDALEYYEKAAYLKDNEFTTPLFLFKAGRSAMDLGQFAKAEKIFNQIKEDYPTTDIGKDIDKYIYSAKYAQ